MDKLYLDFDENGLLTMYIEGNLDKFKSTLKFNNNKYIFGVEKRLIKDKNLIDKLKYERVSLIPKVDTINTTKNKKTEPINGEKYEVHDLPNDIIFDVKDFYSLVPLEWKDNGKYFTCLNTSYTRSTVMSMYDSDYLNDALPNVYLNDTILPIIFEVKTVDRIDSYEAKCNVVNGILDRIEFPAYARKMDIKYENGKIILERPTTLIKINIPKTASQVDCEWISKYTRNGFLYDIYIPNSVKQVDYLYNFYSNKINSLIFDKDFNGHVAKHAFVSSDSVNNLKIPCNIELMKSIINFSYDGFTYIFGKNSKLTITYKDENELLNFLNYFIRLDRKLDSKNIRSLLKNSRGELEAGVNFKFDNEVYKIPLYFFKKNASLSDIDIMLCGTELSKKVQNKIKKMIKNDKVHFVIDELEKTKDQNQEVNKITLIADDVIEEIKSINYFGLDKEKVNGQLKAIIDKYNEDLDNLKVSNKGLTLHSNEGLYTNLLLKLNELKDSLYQKFEKNLVVYDMLDEENILISILNGEEVIINNSLESDFYLLSKNILPFVEKKVTDDLRNYLESEKQKLENYLLTEENKPYDDMDKFILNIRTYLNITLLSIRNYLNKEEILEVIKDYANMQMQINYQEPIKNYLSILLQEIDKTKKEILSIDKTADIDDILNMLNINYQALESMEIIAHLTNIFNKLYRFYLNVKYERDLNLKMESYKIKL